MVKPIEKITLEGLCDLITYRNTNIYVYDNSLEDSLDYSGKMDKKTEHLFVLAPDQVYILSYFLKEKYAHAKVTTISVEEDRINAFITLDDDGE